MGATLVAEHLNKSYRRRAVVQDVSLHVEPGEVVGLLGPNGAGKTTSFNVIAGLLAPDSGSVALGGACLGRLPLYLRARMGLGYLPQESTVFRGLAVGANLKAVCQVQGLTQDETSKRVDAMLDRYNLNHLRKNLGSQLSGGERRRLEMARTLICKPKVLLLDEPFAGIDPIAIGEIQGFIRSVRDDGIGILLTDHNVRETLGICDRAYIISEGRILFAGTPQAIVENEQARKTYLGANFRL